MTEFIGQPGIKHVQQPHGSELCFAAIVSGITDGISIDEVHNALVTDHVSEADGSTGIVPAETIVPLDDDTNLVIEPFHGMSVTGLFDKIKAHFDAGEAVALLHKKNDDDSDDRHHWTLLTGRYQITDQDQLISLRDPLQPSMNVVSFEVVCEMIDRTMEYNGAAFACALTVEQVS